MKTFLEINNEKSQKFWEITTRGKATITRYGKIGSEGKEVKKTFDNSTFAEFEMYKQIIAKRRKGYASPNMVSMEDLLNSEPHELVKLDKDLYDQLQGRYNNAIFVDGDLTLDELDLDELHNKANGLIITGDLRVDEGIMNYEGDYGPFLIVNECREPKRGFIFICNTITVVIHTVVSFPITFLLGDPQSGRS